MPSSRGKYKVQGKHSYLLEYCDNVITGKIVACEDIKKVCKRLSNDVKNKYKRWHYDIEAAQRPINFIESFCCYPTGKLGRPFLLELYEKAWIEATFGFVDDDGLRRYKEVLIEVARKCGKTSVAAAIEIYMLIADGEGAPQIYNLATGANQAELAFNACVRMIKQSPKLKKYIRKRADDLYAEMNMGYIKPLSSNTGSMDGFDSHFAVLDELAAMKNRDLYDLIKQSDSARDQPLLLEISTNGFVRNNIFDAQIKYAEKWLDGTLDPFDDRFLAFIYRLDDREEWKDEKCWIKANPGLGTVKKYETLRGYVDKAIADPTFLPTVMVKDFNMPENSAQAWLTYDEAVNDEIVDIKSMGFKYGIFGFDASDSIDLSAAKCLMMRPEDDHIYELSMYWIPEDVIENDANDGNRRERDSVPYTQWIQRDLLRTVPGHTIDKRVFLDWMEEVKEEYDIWPYAIGYDPWHMTESVLVSEYESYVGKDRFRKVRFGKQTLSQPMKRIRADYKVNRVIDNHNPINEWNRMNVAVRPDLNGNIQPEKKDGDPRNRIDGFAAEICAYTVLLDIWDDYQQAIE